MANIKAKVDVHKYSDHLHIYRLRSECNRRTTRYIFHNVSGEDLVLAMETWSTIILATTRQFFKYLLLPGTAASYRSTEMTAKLDTWPLSQAFARGILNIEGAAIETQPNFKSKNFEFFETIDRDDTSMDELVEAFTQKLNMTPSNFKGTIYRMDWDPKLTLFFINLPATMEFMLFFLSRTDSLLNLHYGIPLGLLPRHLHVATLPVSHTNGLQRLHVDGKHKKIKYFPEAKAIDTVEYTTLSFNKPLVAREVAIKVLRTCPTDEHGRAIKLTQSLTSTILNPVVVQHPNIVQSSQ